jgi:hypothetical protein
VTELRLSPELTATALRLAGARPDEWLCPVCGDVVPDSAGVRKSLCKTKTADELLCGPPVHEHRGRVVELIPRASL